MTHDPTERAWNSTLPKGKGFQPKPHWKGYRAGNSLADDGPRESKIAPRSRSENRKPRKPLPAKSAKTAARDREYSKARAAHLAANPWCVFPLKTGGTCGKQATDCHHREPRGIAPDRVVDPTNFVSLCSEHHRLITDKPWIGYKNGLLVRSSYEVRRQMQADQGEGEADDGQQQRPGAATPVPDPSGGSP